MTLFLKNMVRFSRVQWLRLRSCVIPAEITVSKQILILAPHPDDEVMGCGGLIQRLCAQGNPPHVVILTGGGKSHAGCCNLDEETIKTERRNSAKRILSSFGLPESNLNLLDFPDGGISPTHPEMEKLTNLVSEIKPESVFIPHQGEGWPDHLVCKDLVEVIPSLKSAQVYEYCVWFWYYNVWKLDWKKAEVLPMSKAEHAAKVRAEDDYTTALAPCGKPWTGVLPGLLLKACKWNKELYFRVR